MSVTKSLEPGDAKLVRSLFETHKHLGIPIVRLGQKIVHLADYKLDAQELPNELSEEVQGLRILLNADERLLVIYRGQPTARLIALDAEVCRVLIKHFTLAEHDINRVDLNELERELEEFERKENQLTAAA